MGKTKTAFISGAPEEGKSSKELLREKRERQKQLAEKRQEEKKKAQVSKVGLKGGERIATVGAGPIIEEESKEKEEETKKEFKPKVRGKKYVEAKNKIDSDKLYKAEDAIKLVKETSYSEFDGSVEAHLVVKKVGQSVKLSFPHSAGKKKKIEVAGDKTINALKSGKIDFDVLLATPEMMPKLVPFARLLGPRGLMPNPKNGTLLKTKEDAKKYSADTLIVKTEKNQPVMHVVIGKVSMEEKKLEENLKALISKTGSKQVVKAYLTSTMGPSVKLKI